MAQAFEVTFGTNQHESSSSYNPDFILILDILAKTMIESSWLNELFG